MGGRGINMFKKVIIAFLNDKLFFFYNKILIITVHNILFYKMNEMILIVRCMAFSKKILNNQNMYDRIQRQHKSLYDNIVNSSQYTSLAIIGDYSKMPNDWLCVL